MSNELKKTPYAFFCEQKHSESELDWSESWKNMHDDEKKPYTEMASDVKHYDFYFFEVSYDKKSMEFSLGNTIPLLTGAALFFFTGKYIGGRK